MRLVRLSLLIIITSCSSQHYSDGASGAAGAADITRAQKKHDYVSLQSGANFYTVTFAEIDKAKKNMTVTLDKIDSTHIVMADNPLNSNTTLKAKGSKQRLHIHLTDSISYTYDEPHTIALSKIARVNVVTQ